MTLSDLQLMGSSEFEVWRKYYQEEPWGSVRDNLHAGIIAATVWNTNRPKNSRALQPREFMLVSSTADRQSKTKKALAWFKAMAMTGKKNGGPG